MRLSGFMARLCGLTAVGQVVFAVAAARLLHSALAGATLAALGTAAFVPVGNRVLRGERRALDVPYFVHWTAGFLALPLAIVFALAALALRRPLGDAAVLAYLVALAVAAYGAFIRRRWVATERVSVAIDGLDPRFDGYRIAHLSDLHIGPFTPRAWGLGWARAANALGCDLVVVTGDLVTQGDAFHDDVAEVVGALRAKDGVLVVLGNHDYSPSPEALVAKIEARGARVLRNHGVLPQSGLFVAGIDDRWSRRSDLDAALRARPEGASAILLAHDPADFAEAASRGVDLVLSGHTHGGQIALPLAARRFNVGRFHRRHTHGLYREGRSALVVHPGLGTSGPPVRVGVAPAIVEVTLRAGRARRAGRASSPSCRSTREGDRADSSSNPARD